MELFLLISSLLRIAAIALQNPALDAGADAVKYALALSRLAAQGRMTIEELRQQSELLQKMIEDNRAPTDEEFAALRALSDDLSKRIQDA